MSVPISFVYRSQQGASLVELAGSFNNWTPVPMTRGPWEWTLSIKLAPGQYQYKYMEDNEWRHDKDKPTQNDNMGNLNNIITVEKKDDEDTVEFKSNGDAGIHRKTRMGTYIKTDQLSRGRPVFEQAIQEKGEKKYFLFIGPDGCWRVGPDITTYSGSLLKTPKPSKPSTPNLPPKFGWCYYLNDKWNQDDSLQVIVNVKNDPGKTLDGTQTSRQPSQDVKTAVLDAIEADAGKIKSTGRWDDETTVDEYKEIFMEMDENVNFDIGFFGHTPLMVAAVNGFEEVCKVLISAGADPNKINRNWGVKETALMFAAQAGWPEVCEILLSAGADINQRNHEGYGKTALDIAKEHKNTGVVEVLEKHGATASQIELAQILDFHGISLSEIDDFIDKQDEDEEMNESTPLLFAVREGNKDACTLMIEAGADVNIIHGSGITVLMVAAGNGSTEIFKMLLEAGADIEKQNDKSNTALHLCSSDGHGDIAKMLIAAGADIKKRNVHGETALYLASSEGSTEIVKMLIKEGADLDVADTGTQNGFTPLIKAAKEGYTEVCRLLIEAGALVDKELIGGGTVGQTALLWAALDRHTETSTLLIKAGASIQKVTNLEMDYDWEKDSQQWLAKLGEELGQE